jgi:hypothetical protein
VASAGYALNIPGYEALPFPEQVGAVRRAWARPARRLLVCDGCEDPTLLRSSPSLTRAVDIAMYGYPLWGPRCRRRPAAIIDADAGARTGGVDLIAAVDTSDDSRHLRRRGTLRVVPLSVLRISSDHDTI